MDVLDTTGALTPPDTNTALDGAAEPIERDFEAEAKAMGWRPAAEFKGDPGKHMDAKLFVERGETFLPFIKKDRDETKRELAELRRTVKQAAAHYEKVEERAYQRAVTELEARHADAIETGDLAAGKAVLRELRELEKPTPVVAESAFDQAAASSHFEMWQDTSDYYGVDQLRTDYADRQASQMGKVANWAGGIEDYTAEVDRRVARRFADKKPSAVNGGGNRSAPSGGGKSFGDLPPEARAMADKFIRSGLIKSREEYVKSYQFD